MDGMEHGLFGPARIAQLEQEDLQRYQRSILQNPSCLADEAPDYQDEFRSQLLELMDMVRQFRNDLKSISSPSEDENKPAAMPVSDNDDFGAWIHSALGSDDSDPTDGSLDGGMSSFDNINCIDSSNLEAAMVSDSAINSGFKVLSIYCAHMTPKWNSILEMRPTQRNDMSVEVYYDRFYTWKKKLDELAYIGGEESYIDDFLFGLKKELAVRVWEYNWKPQTLYGAFHRALIEENMMKNDAEMVLDEMPNSTSIGIQGAKYVLDENVNVVLNASGLLDVKLQLDLPTESNFLQSGKWDKYCKDATLEIMFDEIVFFMFDPGGCPLSNLKMYEQSTLIELNEGDVVDRGVVLSVTNLQAVLGPLGDNSVNSPNNGSAKAWVEGSDFYVFDKMIMHIGAHKVFDKMPESILDELYVYDLGTGANEDQLDINEGQMNVKYIRAALLEERVIDLSAQDADFIKLLLFDPGGDIKYAYGLSEGNFRHTEKKDEHNDEDKLKDMEFISLIASGAVRSPTFYNSFSFLYVQHSRMSCLMKFEMHLANFILYDEVYFLCTTSDQDAPRLRKGHDISAGHAKVPFTAAGILGLRVPFGDKYCFIDFSHFRMFQSDVPAIIYLVSDGLAHGDSLSKSLFEGVNSKLLSKLLSCWTVSLDSLIDELGFMSCFESRISLLSPLRVNLVWDPGQDVILLYIIEDNDVLKRKGIGIQLALALKQEGKLDETSANERNGLIGVFETILRTDVPMKWLCGEPHASFCSIIPKGFVWDPGRDFNGDCVRCKTEFPVIIGKYFGTTPSFITKAVRHGVCKLELRGFLVFVTCVRHSVQWYDCFVRVRSCRPHNIKPAQIIETFSESVEMIILNGVELTLQTKQGLSVWWKAILMDISPNLCSCGVFFQLRIWNLFLNLQMSMAKESNMLQTVIEHLLLTNVAMTNNFVLALLPTSCDPYFLWQCHIKNAGTNAICLAAKSAPILQGQTTTTIRVLCCSILMLWLVAVLAYTNAMKGAAISKMLYGIPMFVFRPP